MSKSASKSLVSTISPPRLKAISHRRCKDKLQRPQKQIHRNELSLQSDEKNHVGMTKAIILDMGGVILDLDMELCIRNFKEKAGFEGIEEYLDIYRQRGFISNFEGGLIDENGFYEECLKHCPAGTTPKVIEDCFCSLLVGAKPDMVRQIKELSKSYTLYVLSNNNPICTRRFLRILEDEGIRDCFTGMFLSYKMGLLKPGRFIFDRVIESIGFKPEECLFVDDSIANVEGGRAAGLDSVLYKEGLNISDYVK